jgi:hypothetical protein
MRCGNARFRSAHRRKTARAGREIEENLYFRAENATEIRAAGHSRVAPAPMLRAILSGQHSAAAPHASG